jgi:predicted Zn-dependent protease
MQERVEGGFGHSWKRIAVEIGLVLAGLGLLVGGGLWLVARSAGVLVRFVPASFDRQLGELAFSSAAPEGERCTRKETQAYVEGIASALTSHLHAEGVTFQLVVIDRESVNAFALPGGFVAVHMGLLEKAETGEEVAGVLAHELHHVTLRHGTTRILRQAGGWLLLQIVFGGTDLATLARLAAGLGQLAYDRDQEREADRGGHEVLSGAGIDPRGMATFFERLGKEEGGLAGAVGLLSSHPELFERAKEAALAAEKVHVTQKLPSPKGLTCR